MQQASRATFTSSLGSSSARPFSSMYIYTFIFTCTYTFTYTIYIDVHLGSYVHDHSCLVVPHHQQGHPPQRTYINNHAYICKFANNNVYLFAHNSSQDEVWDMSQEVGIHLILSAPDLLTTYVYLFAHNQCIPTSRLISTCILSPGFCSLSARPSSSMYIYKHSYNRMQIYIQHVCTYISAYIYMHILASSRLIISKTIHLKVHT